MFIFGSRSPAKTHWTSHRQQFRNSWLGFLPWTAALDTARWPVDWHPRVASCQHGSCQAIWIKNRPGAVINPDGQPAHRPGEGPYLLQEVSLCQPERALMPHVSPYTWHLWTLWRVCDKRGSEQEWKGRWEASWAGLARERQRYCSQGSMSIRNENSLAI